jgi:uncharacterized protein YjeT (DUF2065 family)
MSGDALVTALGIFLVAEGLLPLIAPRAWRDAFQRLMQFKDGQLRFFGLLFCGLGLVLVSL